MTPTSIRTGRQFDARTSSFDVAAGVAVQVAPADANRVALVVALATADFTTITAPIRIGPTIGPTVVSLSALSPGHPVCYLSVDKMGSAIFPALYVYNGTTDEVTVGVTIVRQVQELP